MRTKQSEYMNIKSALKKILLVFSDERNRNCGVKGVAAISELEETAEGL